MERYLKNHSTITHEQQQTIASTRVLVIGLGGLGGVVVEGLARIGFLNIGICDKDVFEESNLNRQLLATEKTIGMSKVEVAKQRIYDINSNIHIQCYECAFPSQRIVYDLMEYDLVIDCLDNTNDRKLLANVCIENKIAMIHGAIMGEYGYLSVITLHNQFLNYQINENNSNEEYGNPYYTVVCVGSLQVNLAIKYILNQEYLKKGFYYVDLKNMQIEKIEIE